MTEQKRSAEWPAARTVPRRFLLCIRTQTDGICSGEIYHVYRPQPQPFHGLADAVLKMDDMMNELCDPQTAGRLRSFREKAGVLRNDNAEQREAYRQWRQPAKKQAQQFGQLYSWESAVQGAMAFDIMVRFRQHSSWQGEIIWQQEGQRASFRSVIELLHLLQSVLNGRPMEEVTTQS